MNPPFFGKTLVSVLCFGLWLVATTARAEDGSNFRCEIIREAKLVDLKAKLVENCDLSKPFSFSQEASIRAVYTYCCTTKKQ